MVDQKILDQWKLQYTYVYEITIDGVEYYYRTLTRDEHIAICTKHKNFDVEQEIVNTCLLELPKTRVNIANNFNIVPILSEIIMIKSKFTSCETEEI